MKFTSLIAAAVLAPLVAAGAYAQDCKPAHEFTTVTPGKLTVAAYELMPYISVKDGVFGGIDSEIVKEIAKMECLEIEMLSLDPAAVINAVLAGKADMAVGDWYRTEARSKVLDLSAPLYLDQMGIISKDGVAKISDLKGKKVGNVQGYLWYDDVAKVFGDNAVSYNNAVSVSADLAAGRIDGAFESYVVGLEAQKSGAYAGLQIKVVEADDRVGASTEPGQANFPYTKGNTTLGAALDADIAELHKNGKIAEILKKFGLDPSGADTGAPRLIK
jgi:polar amino acid transport system substrate-binding protein